MAKEKLTYSVKDIFTNFLSDPIVDGYSIPDYQRGYKWTASNVTVLLHDIDKFKCAPNSKQFYCLQHITLHINTDGRYNIIDGQQRLTTLYIILAYLGKGDMLKDKLHYEIRQDTHTLLEEQIRTKKFWTNECSYKPCHKDEYYICEVAKAIHSWFLDNKDIDKKEYCNKLLDNVDLIVNKPNGLSEQKIFNVLNGHRVPLDGSDLVRAIMITKAAKEHFKEEKSSNITDFRIKMGMEIDSINTWWSDGDVNNFYSQLISTNAASENGSVRFKSIPISLLYRCFFDVFKKENEKKFSFSFFEYGRDFNNKDLDDNWEMFDHILKLHATLKDWYDDNEIYHLLGYLFSQFKGKVAELNENIVSVTLNDIWKSWDSSVSKSDFKNLLRKNIKILILNDYKSEDGKENPLDKLNTNILNIKHDWFGEQGNLVKLLIFEDILYSHDTGKRLSVSDFRRSSDEQVEHIWCQNPKDESLGDLEAVKLWKNALVKLMASNSKQKDDKNSQTLKEDISTLKKILKKKNLIDEEDKTKFKEVAKRNGAYSIGNLVLLHHSVNQQYGNADYQD